MRPGDWIQLGSLLVAAIGLRYLVRYVEYTKRIAEEAVNQTEASFKPAIIALPGQSTDADSKLRNIGRGPALDVEWRITGTDHKGYFGCIDAGSEPVEMRSSDLAELVIGALKSPSKNDCCNRVLLQKHLR